MNNYIINETSNIISELNNIIDISFENVPFNLTNIIHLIGYLTPSILLVITVFLLRNKTVYFSFFFYGYFVNIIINSLLKFILKIPRPVNDWKILELGITHTKRIGFDKYGMPSGHAQHCGFILAFATLVFQNPLITSSYSILSLICLYQRYLYQNHTIGQIIIGFIVGLIIGYLFYEMAFKKLVRNIKRRPDDNAPI